LAVIGGDRNAVFKSLEAIDGHALAGLHASQDLDETLGFAPKLHKAQLGAVLLDHKEPRHPGFRAHR
jgi:hypothetical protein